LLYISGPSVFGGYWNRPKENAAAFLERDGVRWYNTGDLVRWNPDDGYIYAGRKDRMVKRRGYRIELGEIESALHSLSGLQECAVVAVSVDGFEGARICCAYVPLAGHTIAPLLLRRELSRLVPAYMLPTHWLACDALPKNANGKIDRPKLVEEFKNHEAPAA